MTEPDYRALPKRVDLAETVEEVDTCAPPAPEPGPPEPDRGWFASGG